MKVLVSTFKKSADGLILLVFVVLLSMILFATGMFFGEQVGEHFDQEQQLWIREDGSVRYPKVYNL
jgi:hypothetical protein